MAKLFYPAILFPPGEDGLFGVMVPGANVFGSGSTAEDALADASEILQELCDNLADKGEEVERPPAVEEIDTEGGQLVMLPVLMPAELSRLNIMMDATLVRRIDAVAPNRSAFLSAAARAQLAALRSEQIQKVAGEELFKRMADRVTRKPPAKRKRAAEA